MSGILGCLRSLLGSPQTIAESTAPAAALALAVLLLKGAHADGEFSLPEQRELLAVLQAEFGLNITDAAGVLHLARGRMAAGADNTALVCMLGHRLSSDARLRILRLLLRVAAADGDITPGEDAQLRQLADCMQVGEDDYGRLLAAALAVYVTDRPRAG